MRSNAALSALGGLAQPNRLYMPMTTSPSISNCALMYSPRFSTDKTRSLRRGLRGLFSMLGISGLAVRAGCAGRKLVKSPMINISYLWMGVKQGSIY